MSSLARPFASLVTASILLAVGAGCPTDENPGGDPDPDDDAQLEGLEIDDASGNVLSCYVRWSTDEPATSRVEFGEDELVWFVGDDEPVTEHQVFVFGMRGDRTYRLQAVSSTADGTEMRSDDLSYTTGTVPHPLANTAVVTLDTERVQPGWTLANFVLNAEISRTVVVMIDMEGEVVWYHELGEEEGRADVEVNLLDDGVVLIGGAMPEGQTPIEIDLAGNVLWEGPVQPPGVVEFPGRMHHAFCQPAAGEYLLLRRLSHPGGHTSDVAELIDADLNIVWSWDTFDHEDVIGDEYPAGNHQALSPSGDALYFNARGHRFLYKVDRASGDVLWALGDGGDFSVIPAEPESWFLSTHATDLTDDGHVLSYDNGHNQSRPYSRVMEYVLDESAMTAELVWEYPGELADDEWFNRVWGDADRLPNGNTLITAGSMLEDDSDPRIMEVTAEGEKVWQVMLGSGKADDLGGAYMSERIPVLVGQL